MSQEKSQYGYLTEFPRERRQITIPANRPATVPRYVTYNLSTRLLVDEMGGYWLQQPLLVVIPECSTKAHVLWNDFSYEIPTHTVMCPSGSSSKRNRCRSIQHKPSAFSFLEFV